MSSGNDRQFISGQSPFEPIIGFSRAVRVRTLHLRLRNSARQSRWHFRRRKRSCPADGRLPRNYPRDSRKSRLRSHDIVRTRVYLTSAADWEAVGRVHGKYFALSRPASTMVVVAALLRPEWKVEVEADAIISEEG